MSREDDAIIAEWLGWTDCRKRAQGEWGGFTPDNYGAIIPHFTTSDADAISMLPRGYHVALTGPSGAPEGGFVLDVWRSDCKRRWSIEDWTPLESVIAPQCRAIGKPEAIK